MALAGFDLEALVAKRLRATWENALRFWANSKAWPSDTAEYVFMARAVHTVGEALFHDEWSSEEPVEWAAEHLRRFGTENQAATAMKRMSLVIRTIVANAEGGGLKFASRRFDLLAFAPMVWEPGRVASAFFDCRLRPRGHEIRKKGWSEDLGELSIEKLREKRTALSRPKTRDWIFVVRRTLDAWLTEIADPSGREPVADEVNRLPVTATMKPPSERRLREWCSKLIQSSIMSGKRPSMTDAARQAAMTLGPIPRALFRKAWRDARPLEWDRPGRPIKAK